MKIFLKNFMIYCVGFTLYQTMEGLFKMFFSHHAESFTMGILGGLSILLIGGLNRFKKYQPPIPLQMIIGGLIITLLEFVTGCIFNLWLLPMLGKPIIWDYSNIPGNILGQICPQFTIIWMFLSIIAIFVDDYLRWKVYGDPKPHYKWWFGCKKVCFVKD